MIVGVRVGVTDGVGLAVRVGEGVKVGELVAVGVTVGLGGSDGVVEGSVVGMERMGFRLQDTRTPTARIVSAIVSEWRFILRPGDFRGFRVSVLFHGQNFSVRELSAAGFIFDRVGSRILIGERDCPP